MPCHKVEFLDRDRARAPEPSARVTGVPALRISGCVAKLENRLPTLEAIERAHESGGPRRAAELTIGDRFEASLLLEADRIDDASFLDFAELRLRETTADARTKRVFQLARTKQAPDMLSAKRGIQLHPAGLAPIASRFKRPHVQSSVSISEQWTRPFCARRSN